MYRKGAVSRLKNENAKSRRGVSPTVTDSPASLGAAEISIQDEDDSTHMSMP